jgi:hypothetical protein
LKRRCRSAPVIALAPIGRLATSRFARCEPLTEIDFYRERLEGCMSCNVWITTAGARRKIPQEDIEALRGISRDVDR